MKAVILSAGVGSRIRPLTDNTPKSLLKVGGKAILERMIDNLIAVEIKEIAIVTGYLEDQIKDFVAKNYPDLNVTFIRNDVYDQTNTAYSLNLTKDFVGDDDFIKFDADVVFEREVLVRLINSYPNSSLCIDKNIHLDKEEVKVITKEGDRVLQVGKKLDPTQSKGESVGIEKITKDAGKVLFEELAEVLSDPTKQQEYYDDSYTTLIEKGLPFYAVDITGLKWVEVDIHRDFKRANSLFS